VCVSVNELVNSRMV